MIQEGKLPGNFKLPPGALLSENQIFLRLKDINEEFDIGPSTQRDPELQAGLEEIILSRGRSYRVALLDITDPLNPRYAAVADDEGYIPGSVGKILVLTGMFDQLAKRFPERPADRAALLRQVTITADSFVLPNSHAVPVVGPGFSSIRHRSIRVDDSFSLWEWIDHMVSPSSNAAASMVWRQALLLDRFGSAYPPDPTQESRFLEETARTELSRRAIAVLFEPLEAAGLNTERLRQRTFFTRNASRTIPGRSSFATPRQLVRWLIKLEQGKLIDEWSSLEMKKLLYFTRRRYRYAASPALSRSAVFFKSGSLYRCKPEPDYRCGQYRGNELNLMHSVAIVESPSRKGGPPRIYLIAMMSNVLKVNSAQEHLEIANRIEELIQSLRP